MLDLAVVLRRLFPEYLDDVAVPIWLPRRKTILNLFSIKNASAQVSNSRPDLFAIGFLTWV